MGPGGGPGGGGRRGWGGGGAGSTLSTAAAGPACAAAKPSAAATVVLPTPPDPSTTMMEPDLRSCFTEGGRRGWVTIAPGGFGRIAKDLSTGLRRRFAAPHGSQDGRDIQS